MPFTKIWIHAVWATAERKPLLTKAVRAKVFDHIEDNARQKGIFIDRINGHFDHVHVLFSLPKDQTVSNCIQLMKGESSFWINKHSLIRQPFQWQEEYYAASISDRGVPGVRNYIDNQEEHHRSKSALEEYDELIQEITVNLPVVRDS